MKLTVIGGTGLIGSQVVQKLSDALPGLDPHGSVTGQSAVQEYVYLPVRQTRTLRLAASLADAPNWALCAVELTNAYSISRHW